MSNAPYSDITSDLKRCSFFNILAAVRPLLIIINVPSEWGRWCVPPCTSINTDSYPHAFKSGEGSEGPQGPQRPQRLDGCEVRITQSVGHQTDE